MIANKKDFFLVNDFLFPANSFLTAGEKIKKREIIKTKILVHIKAVQKGRKIKAYLEKTKPKEEKRATIKQIFKVFKEKDLDKFAFATMLPAIRKINAAISLKEGIPENGKMIAKVIKGTKAPTDGIILETSCFSMAV